MADGNSNDPSDKPNDSGSRWQEGLSDAFERLRKSPFARRAMDFAKGELDRLIGYPTGTARLDASRAHQLSTNLHQIMANLIAECKEEQRKLRSGGILGIGGRDLSAQDVDTAVAGFSAITFHLENEILDHLRRARAMGSSVAQQFVSVAEEDAGATGAPTTAPGMAAAGLGGRGVVGAFALSPERLRLVVERLRGIHEYAIKFASDIQEDIAGPHVSSPSAHEKALSKAIMLAQRMEYACTQILQLLDPGIDPRVVISGNTGKLQALPPSEEGKGGR